TRSFNFIVFITHPFLSICTVGFHKAEHLAGDQGVVGMSLSFDKAAGDRRENVESRSVAQDLHDPVAFVYLISRIDKPDTQPDGIGAQVGQNDRSLHGDLTEIANSKSEIRNKFKHQIQNPKSLR